MIYLKYTENPNSEEQFIFFNTLEEKESWIKLKDRELVITGLTYTILTDGDLSKWVKDNLVNIANYEKKVVRLETIKTLEDKKQELELALLDVQRKLNEFNNTPDTETGVQSELLDNIITVPYKKK